jgi:hypothetical protein
MLGEEEIACFDIIATQDAKEKSFGSILSLLWQSLIKL